MDRVSREPTRDAFILLKIVFVVLPLLAGVDKFFYFLVDWSQYLSAVFGGYGDLILMIIGVVEMLVGIGVFFKPRIFAPLIGVWLALIIINLLILGTFYDVAVIDFGLCLSAFALGRLAKVYS